MRERCQSYMLLDMNVDLHTHTRASDGLLEPEELIERAATAGVDMLAVTDHDSVASIAAATAAAGTRLQLIAGTELSTTWRGMGIHVLGLNIDVANPTLASGIAQQREGRELRAEMIAARLEKLGFHGTLAGAQALAGSAPIGRPHFARYLVASGQSKDISTVFRRLLGSGKPGDVRSTWAELPDVIAWINAAGGVAALAHPAKYKLSNMKLTDLVTDFAAAGGGALEVISGAQTAQITQRLAQLTMRYDLQASAGSDFHRPGESWADVGSVAALPPGCRPVWHEWAA
jgi:predicted metal-dependent phosphoesterase TrpH